MKYRDEILKGFTNLKFQPRNKQLETVNNILIEYLDNKKEIVVLSSPTGTGKSIIAAVVAECLNTLDPESSKFDNKKAFYLMNNNTLTKQYYNTFSDNYSFANVMGANNYNCRLIGETAEDCIIKGNFNSPKISDRCKGCLYRKSRLDMNTKSNLIANYSLFFVYTMYADRLDKRMLTVYDESHMLNELFCNHVSVNMSIKILDSIIRSIEKTPLKYGIDNYKQILYSYIRLFRQNLINKNNYKMYLEKIYETFKQLGEDYKSESDKSYSKNNISGYKNKNKIANRLLNSYMKYIEFNQSKYEFVVDIKNDSLAIQPIFVNDMFKKFNRSKYSLFMSATIDKKFIQTTLNIDNDKISFIKTPPVFDPSHKKIYFLNHDSYNYKKLKDKNKLNEINMLTSEILKNHEHEKGVILTPSFNLNENISNHIKFYNRKLKMFEQKRGEHLSSKLIEFKDYKLPSVLISPSIFEGVDMADDHSKFQIMVKAPYQSLASERIKHIMNKYPDIYKIMTIHKIIQGFGRSTRNDKDKSVTYCLDYNIYRLFNDYDNHWKDEFEVIEL